MISVIIIHNLSIGINVLFSVAINELFYVNYIYIKYI